MIAINVVGLITKGMMLASGVGLLRGQAWGRRVGVIWAWLSMAYGLVSVAVNAAVIMPKVWDATIQDAQNQAGPGSAQTVQMMQSMEGLILVFTVLFGIAMALGYQITSWSW